jgi:hypothetical protein
MSDRAAERPIRKRQGGGHGEQRRSHDPFHLESARRRTHYRYMPRRCRVGGSPTRRPSKRDDSPDRLRPLDKPMFPKVGYENLTELDADVDGEGEVPMVCGALN